MKLIKQLFLGFGFLGCIAAIIVCARSGADLGQYGYIGLIATAALFALLLMVIPIAKFIKDNFKLSYDKENGLKVQEQEMQECQ